jgi:hypothetical protein
MMPPILSVLATLATRRHDPREDVTEEDVIFDSTLVERTQDQQGSTTITRVNRETSDEN